MSATGFKQSMFLLRLEYLNDLYDFHDITICIFAKRAGFCSDSMALNFP